MIRLLKTRMNKENFYSQEEVFITCTFYAPEDMPIDRPVRLSCKFKYGHMLLDAARHLDFCAEDVMYPQPMCYRRGNSYASTVRWEIPDFKWAGRFQILLSLVDDEENCVPFMVGDKIYEHFMLGYVNVPFTGVAKSFMDQHAKPVEREYGHCDLSEALKPSRGIVYIRRIEDDGLEYALFDSDKSAKFKNERVSFDFIRADTECYVENISEKSGYEFLKLEIPCMICAEDKQMVCIHGTGKLVDPQNSLPWGYAQKNYVRNVGLLTNDKETDIYELPYLDDLLHYSVVQVNNKKWAAMGVTFTYRMRAFGELESPKVVNIPYLKMDKIHTDLFGVLPKLREGLVKKTHLFDNSLFYYYGVCDGPGEESRTFKDALDHIRKIYNITGGVKQFVLLCGWQHEGHDTGYPNVFKLNEKAGTMDDLKECVEEAVKYNAVITFHDNYDDLYEGNGFFDKDIAAFDERGDLFRSWIWTSGISVMTSFKKYIKSGKMQERVKKTLHFLPINKYYHIDVLSCEIRRYDYSEDQQSMAEETVGYKKEVIKEFEKNGIIVTSETLSHKFVNDIGYAWRLHKFNSTLFTSEEKLPFIPMIYHGICPYSDSGIDGIVNGASVLPPKKDYKRIYFTRTLPLNLFVNDLMIHYCYNDGVYINEYEHGYSEYNVCTDQIKIVYEDNIVTYAGNSLCPGYKSDQYFGYTESGKFIMKKYFDGNVAGVVELDESGERKSIEYLLEDGYLIINTKENTAFEIIISDAGRTDIGFWIATEGVQSQKP